MRFKIDLAKVKIFIFPQLLSEVVPIMIAYACVGCISAVMQLISVTLASAYVAQVSRKRIREKQQTWVCRNTLENQVCTDFLWTHY